MSFSKNKSTDFFHQINSRPYHRIIELPLTFELEGRCYPNISSTFFVTKKIHIEIISDPNINPMMPSHTPRSYQTTTCKTIIVDLLKMPFEVPSELVKEERFKWDRILQKDPIYLDRKEFFELRGDKYLVDYDIEVLLRKIDAIEE